MQLENGTERKRRNFDCDTDDDNDDNDDDDTDDTDDDNDNVSDNIDGGTSL